MKKHKNLEKYVPVVGVVSILLITLSALVFSRAQQCPTYYTQQQVDTSSCTNSATTGFSIILAISMILLAVMIAIFVIKKRREVARDSPIKKK